MEKGSLCSHSAAPSGISLTHLQHTPDAEDQLEVGLAGKCMRSAGP